MRMKKLIQKTLILQGLLDSVTLKNVKCKFSQWLYEDRKKGIVLILITKISDRKRFENFEIIVVVLGEKKRSNLDCIH